MKDLAFSLLEKTLKSLSRATIRRYKPGIIGVTGNAGKTSAKEAIRTVLARDRRVRASARNFNNELGLPLAVLGNWQKTGGALFYVGVIGAAAIQLLIKKKSYPEILILEYGVEKPGDMKKLLEIARPNIGVVTAIGETPVHIEFFAGREALAREKARLLATLPAMGFAVLNADEKIVAEMEGATRARAVTYGFSEGADVKISNFEMYVKEGVPGVTFKLEYGGSFVPVRLPRVVGKAQAYAAGAAAAVGCAFGMHLVKISEALEGYVSPKGRMKTLLGIKQSVIIDDTYNGSPLAMEEALKTLKEIKAKRKIAVLGDMLELGKYTIEAHEKIGRITVGAVRTLVTVGDKARFIAEGAAKAGLPQKDIFAFQSVREAGRALQKMLAEGDVVLVKGSEGVRMEKVVQEVMAEPEKAEELLVRQDPRWLDIPGMYE